MTEQYYRPSINDPRIVRDVDADFTVTTDEELLVFDTTAGAIVATLPDASVVPGQLLYFKATNAGTTGNAVTLAALPGQNIDGALTLDLTADEQAVVLQSEGDSYAIISNSASGGGGGGSFGMFNPLVTPATPDPDDIETWTDLPAGWSVWAPSLIGPLPQTRTIDRGALVMDFGTWAAGAGRTCSGIYRSIPPETEWAAYTRLTLIGPRTATGVFIECGFGIAEDLAGDPTGSWIEAADYFQEDANAIQTAPRALTLASFNAGTVLIPGTPPAIVFPGSLWFRVRKTDPADVTRYALDFSTDGIRWQSLHTGADFVTAAGGPSDLVIFVRATPSGATSTPEFRLVVGPVRFSVGAGSGAFTELMPAGTTLT